ncbi:MAG: hypothetical protein KKG33_12530 [candidate division Zixibacteria bacterium]|nr:hypothetical protein [candidate division Zixibacteria bacterium]MBU1469317.1 hypothetical protein [candidate division Zixibacteria bacterium]MBU2626377.1 hypothetical protein [candidate division Zixibacteria bacterium]
MKSEMDVMGMDERQRLCWLLANRVTLMVVGVFWIGMIGWEVINHRVPYFLIAMVPAFAAIRFFTYLVYFRRS